MMFKAILIEKDAEAYRARSTDLDEAQLPEGDVTVRVAYSTLNYKDGLAISGSSPVVRQFPMVPGIDLAGTVEASSNPHYKIGDRVLLNGWGVGEGHWGGLAQKAKLRAEWLIPLPETLSERPAMAIGTAGYTAMLCLLALERQGVTPERGEVLVTGANGGVGSFAIALLARKGYSVIAATGRPAEADYLKRLGATSIIDRNELSNLGRALAKERWAAAIDSVGSHTLANVCAGTRADGVVAACGLAQGFMPVLHCSSTAAQPTPLSEALMLNHVMVGSNDIERSKRFYDAVLGLLGAGEPICNTGPTGHTRLFYRHDGSLFGVTEPINGEEATVANGGTIGFKCNSAEQVQAFHDIGVAHGGTTCEDPPGLRESSLGPMHLGYVRDPDGNKLCAIYRAP